LVIRRPLAAIRAAGLSQPRALPAAPPSDTISKADAPQIGSERGTGQPVKSGISQGAGAALAGEALPRQPIGVSRPAWASCIGEPEEKNTYTYVTAQA
jgi:hypothetical protein